MPPSVDMANQLLYPPSARGVAIRCATLARERSGLRQRLAWAVANLCALEGPAQLGYASQRDYARNGLGISAVRFLRLRRTGALCLVYPDVGTLGFSVIDALAQRLAPVDAAALAPALAGCTYQEALSKIDAAASEATPNPATPDSIADPDYQRVSFTVPSSVAGYLDETLQLASALLGHDAAEADCVDTVVAEASTEIPASVSAQEARRSFAISPAKPRVTSRSAIANCPVSRPRFGRDQTAATRVLDRYLHRLLRRERTIATRLEDAIHDVYQSDAHLAEGFTSFAEFGRQALDMAPSTLHDHLARARLRRRGNPIAEAVAAGRLAPAKAQLVERLHRRCHVPASCLDQWIEFARGHSFRGLFRAIRWAQSQRDADYRAWSNQDFPSPTREQIRASKHSVSEIAHNPAPEALADAANSTFTTTQWVLRRETLDVLLQLMAESRESAPEPEPPPAWWCLLHVFVTAREQWSVVEREPSGVRGRVLRRDDYRCAIPVCSERRSLEVHHIRFRSAGGQDVPENLVTLCAFHHRALHDGRLRIHGRIRETAEDLRYELAIDGDGRARARFRGEEVLGMA